SRDTSPALQHSRFAPCDKIEEQKYILAGRSGYEDRAQLASRLPSCSRALSRLPPALPADLLSLFPLPPSHSQPPEPLAAAAANREPAIRIPPNPDKNQQSAISNRERMEVFHLGVPCSRRLPVTRHSSLATVFLIVTPRLEFLATPTKQGSLLNSN